MNGTPRRVLVGVPSQVSCRTHSWTGCTDHKPVLLTASQPTLACRTSRSRRLLLGRASLHEMSLEGQAAWLCLRCLPLSEPRRKLMCSVCTPGSGETRGEKNMASGGTGHGHRCLPWDTCKPHIPCLFS